MAELRVRLPQGFLPASSEILGLTSACLWCFLLFGAWGFLAVAVSLWIVGYILGE